MKKTKSNLINTLFALLNKQLRLYHEEKAQTDNNQQQYSRRSFITQAAKGTAGIAVALSLPSFITSCRNAPTDSNNQNTNKTGSDDILDIAILGGGMAGLNCANHLLGSKLNFKIFEGDRRVGGRILTHYNDPVGIGVYPEFGGDFIDSDHKDMLDLAKEFKLDLVDLIAEQEANHWEKDIYYFGGKKRSEAEIIKEFKKIVPKVAADTNALGKDYDTPEAEKFDNLPLSKYIQSLACASWLKDLFVAAFIAEYGLDCSEMSTLNMLALVDTNTDKGFKVFGTSDERYRVKGGNSKIIEGLADKIGADRIQKEHVVKSVTEQDDGNYIIVFENGNEVKAKAVVCTIPFTILRKLTLKLKNMSQDKMKCIEELGYGKNTKLILGYSGQPWRSKENNAMGYLFTNDMTNGWDGSVNKPEGSTNGAYVAYFGGAFSQKLCDVSTKNPLAPPTHSWRTELPKEKVDGFVNDLDKIFKNSKKQFLGKHIFVNWIEYPFVHASYSCYKVGQWTTIAGLEMQPVGNFFFAGEHCSEQFQGFMNGAAESGRVVATMVAGALKEKKATA